MSRLAEIFEHKKIEVQTAQASVTQAELEAEIRVLPPPKGFRSALCAALHPALIAEVKKASPSQGLIRAEFDPAAIARAYQSAGATCLSVLTDEKFFQGSSENLKRALQASGLPVLRKDFLFDPYQVFEARAWGASAILLIVAMLDLPSLRELYSCARGLGLDVLVEVHAEEEVETALSIGADMIGVNNRDLGTFKTSLGISERLLPLFRTAALAVSESAIETHEDVRRVADAGADAVLIGTTFCAAPDIEAKVKKVMGW